MSRKAELATAELEKTLPRKKSRLAATKKKRWKPARRLGRLDAGIAALLGRRGPALMVRRVDAKPGRKGTLRDTVHNVPATADAPMNVKGIADAAIESGCKTKSKNVSRPVIPIVYRDPGIESVERGKFSLM